jgi:hypothetical protein
LDTTGSFRKKIGMDNQLDDENGEKKKFSWKEFFSLGEVGAYFFRRSDPNRTSNVNIKIMHGINRFAIIVFLLGMIYFIIKRFL